MTVSRFDSKNADVLVYTYKAGVLSTAAHDLQLKFEQFTLSWNGDRLAASVYLPSIRFVTAMKNGKVDRSPLAILGAQEIEKNARSVFLKAKVETVSFESDIVTAKIASGRLNCGRNQVRVEAGVVQKSGETVALFSVDQSALGLAPFRALFGSLQVRDQVQIQVRLREKLKLSRS